MNKIYSIEDRQRFVRDFKASTLSKEEFCKLHKISYASLYRWIFAHSKNTVCTPEQKSFTPITILPENKAINNHLIIELPNNIKLTIPASYNPNQIMEYLKMIRSL